MILYSYICFDCENTWDDWRNVDDNAPKACSVCGSANTGRNYYAENKSVRGDIEPGFNTSIGVRYSGRKDLYNKMKASGFGSISHSGGIVPLDKHHYGEEEYRKNVLHETGNVNQRYLELLQKGVEDGVKEFGPGEKPKLMRKPSRL
ncbi:hypothetical protein LCGC14_0578300 [marine sediment metagenome]|uniref:Uncharacterized protein n=1 Tax=marine sediment metagenome TaxID=412755 RepID=A0A0F9RM87_9ZZZZ